MDTMDKTETMNKAVKAVKGMRDLTDRFRDMTVETVTSRGLVDLTDQFRDVEDALVDLGPETISLHDLIEGLERLVVDVRLREEARA